MPGIESRCCACWIIPAGCHSGFRLRQKVGDLGEDASDLDILGTHLERDTARADARHSNRKRRGDTRAALG